MFTPIGITKASIEKISDILDNEIGSLTKKLSEVINDSIITKSLLPNSQQWIKRLTTLSHSDLFLFNSDAKSLIISKSYERFLVVSSQIENVNTLFSVLNEEFTKISYTTQDFGLSFDKLIFGKDYAIDLLRSVIRESRFKMNEPRNNFESDVIKEIMKITNCLLTNIEISFTKPKENFEYDILVATADGTLINIELTDYTSLKEKKHITNETLKSQIVLTNSDKAKRLNAKIIIIAKGLPIEPFEQIKELSASRDILLVNENNYKQSVEQSLLKANLENIVSRKQIGIEDLTEYLNLWNTSLSKNYL